MRYWEITEGGARGANEVWKQTRRTTDALRVLRAKQARAAADRTAAQTISAGKSRAERLRAADRLEADARRVYDNALKTANDAMGRAVAKASHKG